MPTERLVVLFAVNEQDLPVCVTDIKEKCMRDVSLQRTKSLYVRILTGVIEVAQFFPLFFIIIIKIVKNKRRVRHPDENIDKNFTDAV